MAPALTVRTKPHTVDEVARYLRKSKDAVYREIRAGRLNAIRVGNSLRITEEALDRYMRGDA